MEGISTNVYKGLKKCWRRRGYVRLNHDKVSKPAHIQLGQEAHDPTPGHGRRTRFWRVKISPKIRIWRRVGSPKKWLTRLRDAYVNMMLKFANSGFVGGASGFGGSMEYGFGHGRQIKEYDEKMIVDIYKSLMIAQGQLVPNTGSRAANKLGSQQRISISAR